MNIECLDEIQGAAGLRAWFGRFPRFHDANVLGFQIGGDGTGWLKLQAFDMTDKVDSKGYFILEKHAVVTFRFAGITAINLSEFMKDGAIIFDIEINKKADNFEFLLSSSYGFNGSIRANEICVELQPGVEQKK